MQSKVARSKTTSVRRKGKIVSRATHDFSGFQPRDARLKSTPRIHVKTLLTPILHQSVARDACHALMWFSAARCIAENHPIRKVQDLS
jgi:hypothetical protein